jgi:hypothetical protein
MEALDRLNEIVLRKTVEINAVLDAPTPTASNSREQDRKTDTSPTPDDPRAAPSKDCLDSEDSNNDKKHDIANKREGSTHHELAKNKTPTCDTHALHKLKSQAASYELAIQQYEAAQPTGRYKDDATEASRQGFIRKSLFHARKDM